MILALAGAPNPLPGPVTPSAGFSAMHKFLALGHVVMSRLCLFATSFMVEFA
jgi:hypothetical protein